MSLSLSACGSGAGGRLGESHPSNRLVDGSLPPYIHGLAVNPADRSILLATNRGLFAISADGKQLRAISSRVSVKRLTGPYGHRLSSLAFIGPHRLVGSGHPDGVGSRLPAFLGLIRSDDGGRNWTSVSRAGLSDLHVLNVTRGSIYAFDPVPDGVIVSTDGGPRFAERAPPSAAAVLSLAVDPQDAGYLLTGSAGGLFASADQGRSWHLLARAPSTQLAWTKRGLFRADADGSVKQSSDRGRSWSTVGRLGGAPAKLVGLPDGSLYAALDDATVSVSHDAGRSWSAVERP